MSYATINEIRHFTGTTLGDEILQELLDLGDLKIDAYLIPHGIAGSSTGAAKIAAVELAKAALLDRARLDGTRPDSSSEGDYSESVNIEAAISRHTAEAYRMLDTYIAAQATERRYYVAKVRGV